jgi:hypothetical protein
LANISRIPQDEEGMHATSVVTNAVTYGMLTKLLFFFSGLLKKYERHPPAICFVKTIT